MLFTILLISLVVLIIVAGVLAFTTSSYNQDENAASASCMVLFFGGLACFLILLGAGSSATHDKKNHVVLEEKTYTLAENSVPVYDDTKLSFAYVENGQTLPYSEYVDSFNVGMDKPKAFKITRYDVVDHSILPWVISDGVKVEVIK